MTECRLVRDYENATLPLEKRVPSLACRFSCLRNAVGVKPWSANTFYEWVTKRGTGTCEWHAGHLILNLMGNGPWEAFDAIAAVSTWNDSDRSLFATWAKSWK